MKNLGRILFFLIFYTLYVFGSVKAFVDKDHVTLGDSVTFRIEVQGEDITPPDIDSLCNSDIIATSSQQSIQIVNSSISKSYNFYYTFEPENNCTIESIPIAVDGAIEHTKPIKIIVSSQPQTQQDSDFILKLQTNKKEVFVGESFDVDLIFKQKKDVQAIDSKFFPPKLDGFWIKYQSKPQKSIQGEYIVTTIHYKMAAQRPGELTISPAKIKIAHQVFRRDAWGLMGADIKWKSYFSNPIKLKVLAPPTGIKLVGDFTISFDVDKTTIHPNEAVNGVITIKGDGNLEDIEQFNPFIQNANVFAKKPQIDQEHGVFKEQIAFVSDQNFTIGSFTLRFFNPKTKKIENLQTKPIAISVIGTTKKKNHLVIKKGSLQEEDTKESEELNQYGIDVSFAITWVILSFFAGIFVGAVVVYMKFIYVKQPKTKRFNYKDQKALFIKLLPYKEHEDVKELLVLLEESMYGSKDVEIDKKKLKEIIQKYNIS